MNTHVERDRVEGEAGASACADAAVHGVGDDDAIRVAGENPVATRVRDIAAATLVHGVGDDADAIRVAGEDPVATQVRDIAAATPVQCAERGSDDRVAALVRTVLYEGYALYPYRPSALKNQKRFAFGAVYPKAWASRIGEPFTMRAECVVDGGERVEITIGFLVLHRSGGGTEHAIALAGRPLVVGDWRAAVTIDARKAATDAHVGVPPQATDASADQPTERAPPTSDSCVRRQYELDPGVLPPQITCADHPTHDAHPTSDSYLRRLEAGDDKPSHDAHPSSDSYPRRIYEPDRGVPLEAEACADQSTHDAAVRPSDANLRIELSAAIVDAGDGLWRIALEIENLTAIDPGADREAAMDVTLASTHVLVRAVGGAAVSTIDPPERAANAVAACRTLGCYPVVVARDTVLASPIVLPDFPELAEQSPGDFFDGTEMDEMLTLRVLTLTDDEKREAAAADPRIAALLRRTEQRGIEATAQLHGVSRFDTDSRAGWMSGPRIGTRVRLKPTGRADAFDIILAGKLATVASVERDLDGRAHFAVTIDDDPGADLGRQGMPGHRFYFRGDELEVLA